MEEWQKIRKRYFLLEAAGIAGIAICFLVLQFGQDMMLMKVMVVRKNRRNLEEAG